MSIFLRGARQVIAVTLVASVLGFACGDGETGAPAEENAGDKAAQRRTSGGSAGDTSLPSMAEFRCPENQLSCEGACVSPLSDPKHCGACAQSCVEGEGCADGLCQDFGCGTGQVSCSGQCVNFQNDRENCGDCSLGCGTGELCRGGQCEISCSVGLLLCEGVCLDPLKDRAHCGATDCSLVPLVEGAGGLGGAGGASHSRILGGGAGERCSAGRICLKGQCTISCLPGTLECSGSCIDPLSDTLFCGATDCQVGPEGQGKTCSSAEICSKGACEAW